jgi:hypothetical protein
MFPAADIQLLEAFDGDFSPEYAEAEIDPDAVFAEVLESWQQEAERKAQPVRKVLGWEAGS